MLLLRQSLLRLLIAGAALVGSCAPALAQGTPRGCKRKARQRRRRDVPYGPNRILSPARLPYGWHWADVPVTLKSLRLQEVPTIPAGGGIVAALE
jgi:hypothetical protein